MLQEDCVQDLQHCSGRPFNIGREDCVQRLQTSNVNICPIQNIDTDNVQHLSIIITHLPLKVECIDFSEWDKGLQ